MAINQHTSIHNPQFSQLYKYSPMNILKSPQKNTPRNAGCRHHFAAALVSRPASLCAAAPGRPPGCWHGGSAKSRLTQKSAGGTFFGRIFGSNQEDLSLKCASFTFAFSNSICFFALFLYFFSRCKHPRTSAIRQHIFFRKAPYLFRR